MRLIDARSSVSGNIGVSPIFSKSILTARPGIIMQPFLTPGIKGGAKGSITKMVTLEWIGPRPGTQRFGRHAMKREGMVSNTSGLTPVVSIKGAVLSSLKVSIPCSNSMRTQGLLCILE